MLSFRSKYIIDDSHDTKAGENSCFSSTRGFSTSTIIGCSFGLGGFGLGFNSRFIRAYAPIIVIATPIIIFPRKLSDNFNLKQTQVESRSVNYLNDIVEQDHRFIKRRVRPMLGFKSLKSAESTLAGIELMRMIKKDQMKNPKSTAFQSFVLWQLDFGKN